MTDAAALPGQPRGGVLSGPATARAVNVLAPNASVMTLDGTNTWIVSEPDSDSAVVIDPGPLDDAHLRNVVDTAEKAGKRIALTLLTHGHPDHAEGAARFAGLTRTNVRALDPALRLGDEGLGAGDVVAVGGLELRVVPTPGHTADSLCFHLPADGAVLTGDTVLGRGTTVVAHPDGRLGDYLDSLRRLQVPHGRRRRPHRPPRPRSRPGGRPGRRRVLPRPPRPPARPGRNGRRERLPHPRRGRRPRLRGRRPLPVAGRGTLGTGPDRVPDRARPDLTRSEAGLSGRLRARTARGRHGRPRGATGPQSPLRPQQPLSEAPGRPPVCPQRLTRRPGALTGPRGAAL